MTKYPFSSLAKAMCMSEAAACRDLGIAGRTAQDYRRDGLSEKVADRMAVKAGLVPYVVWPEMLTAIFDDASIPCRECAEAFVPSRPWNVYCSPPCQRRWSGRERQRRRRQDETVREYDRAYKRVYYRENAEYLRRQNREYHRRIREQRAA